MAHPQRPRAPTARSSRPGWRRNGQGGARGRILAVDRAGDRCWVSGRGGHRLASKFSGSATGPRRTVARDPTSRLPWRPARDCLGPAVETAASHSSRGPGGGPGVWATLGVGRRSPHRSSFTRGLPRVGRGGAPAPEVLAWHWRACELMSWSTRGLATGISPSSWVCWVCSTPGRAGGTAGTPRAHQRRGAFVWRLAGGRGERRRRCRRSRPGSGRDDALVQQVQGVGGARRAPAAAVSRLPEACREAQARP